MKRTVDRSERREIPPVKTAKAVPGRESGAIPKIRPGSMFGGIGGTSGGLLSGMSTGMSMGGGIQAAPYKSSDRFQPDDDDDMGLGGYHDRGLGPTDDEEDDEVFFRGRPKERSSSRDRERPRSRERYRSTSKYNPPDRRHKRSYDDDEDEYGDSCYRGKGKHRDRRRSHSRSRSRSRSKHTGRSDSGVDTSFSSQGGEMSAASQTLLLSLVQELVTLKKAEQQKPVPVPQYKMDVVPNPSKPQSAASSSATSALHINIPHGSSNIVPIKQEVIEQRTSGLDDLAPNLDEEVPMHTDEQSEKDKVPGDQSTPALGKDPFSPPRTPLDGRSPTRPNADSDQEMSEHDMKSITKKAKRGRHTSAASSGVGSPGSSVSQSGLSFTEAMQAATAQRQDAIKRATELLKIRKRQKQVEAMYDKLRAMNLVPLGNLLKKPSANSFYSCMAKECSHLNIDEYKMREFLWDFVSEYGGKFTKVRITIFINFSNYFVVIYFSNYFVVIHCYYCINLLCICIIQHTYLSSCISCRFMNFSICCVCNSLLLFLSRNGWSPTWPVRRVSTFT